MKIIWIDSAGWIQETQMKKELTKKAMDLTSELLRDFHRMNPNTVFDLCDENVTWIGAQKEQFIIGKKAFRKELDQVVADMFMCHMENEEFLITENEGNTCTVIGRYLVVSDDEAPGMVASEQRCVAVWKQTDEGLRLLHLSTTSPITEVAVNDDEHFVRSIGTTMKKIFFRRLNAENRKYLFTMRDGDIVTLREYSILYFEAQKKHSYLVTKDRTLELQESFSTVRKKTEASEAFLQISRSFLVNVWHIEKISGTAITMDNGEIVHFPDKKKTQIIEELRKRFW